MPLREPHVVAVARACQHQSMTPAVLTEKIVETDPVRSWRFADLVRAGYPPFDALVLSGRPDVDLHTAVTLLRKGCPTQAALRILL